MTGIGGEASILIENKNSQNRIDGTNVKTECKHGKTVVKMCEGKVQIRKSRTGREMALSLLGTTLVIKKIQLTIPNSSPSLWLSL